MDQDSFLRATRNRLGYSLGDVAEMSNGGLDRTTVFRTERGERALSFRAAYYLSKIYGVDLDVIARKTFGALTVKKAKPKRKKPGRPKKSRGSVVK